MNRRDICLGLLLPGASTARSAEDALHHAMARAREMRALAERSGDQPYGAVVMLARLCHPPAHFWPTSTVNPCQH